MPVFELHFRVSPDDDPVITQIEALDEKAARSAAAAYIAQWFGHPGMLVLLSPNGRFTLGAAFWSRSGSYSLQVLGQGI